MKKVTIRGTIATETTISKTNQIITRAQDYTMSLKNNNMLKNHKKQ